MYKHYTRLCGSCVTGHVSFNSGWWSEIAQWCSIKLHCSVWINNGFVEKGLRCSNIMNQGDRECNSDEDGCSVGPAPSTVTPLGTHRGARGGYYSHQSDWLGCSHLCYKGIHRESRPPPTFIYMVHRGWKKGRGGIHLPIVLIWCLDEPTWSLTKQQHLIESIPSPVNQLKNEFLHG